MGHIKLGDSDSKVKELPVTDSGDEIYAALLRHYNHKFLLLNQ